jgi:3,2-trans-enoyl-CoA isomerase
MLSYRSTQLTNIGKFSSSAVSNCVHTNVSVDETNGIAVLSMNKKPVNSLNLEMLTELTITLEKLESDDKCNGLVITSALPKIFSAGLDINELYQPKPGKLAEFWRALQDFWIKLYVSPLATAAAINGHSPAGGCLMAMSCDYRVMASGNYAIGLNETLLGIVAPFWFIDTMRNVIGQRHTERALQLGLMIPSNEALKIGLVDSLVDESEVVNAAKKELANWLKVPGFARQLTKSQMRKPTVERLLARRDQEIENIQEFLTKDSIQKGLGRYIESLKKPKQQ